MNTLIIVAVLVISLGFFMKPRHGRHCAWCSSYKITFISGTEGTRKWKYSNQDGSEDKRRKDNFEQATYTSEYKCEKCNASTKFLHKESKSPGPSKNILKRELLNNGEGKRKGSDYEGDIHINSGSGIVSLMNSKINQTFLNITRKKIRRFKERENDYDKLNRFQKIWVIPYMGVILFFLGFLALMTFEISINTMPSFWVFTDGRQNFIFGFFALFFIYILFKIVLKFTRVIFWLTLTPFILFFVLWLFGPIIGIQI